jgi:acetylornithine deacetylase/succinyl-diaminopimelate desuccinylase-like protein
LTATGTAGHGSVPLADNAIAHLATAIAAITAWKPPVRLNDTTRTYFDRLAGMSDARERGTLSRGADAGTAQASRRGRLFRRATNRRVRPCSGAPISPTIIQGGYRVNVIPSEAKATLDVRCFRTTTRARFSPWFVASSTIRRSKRSTAFATRGR